MYAKIIVEIAVKNVDKTFTYIIPNDLQNKVKVGCRVTVEFGKQILEGFILEILNTLDNIDYELKEIKELIDDYINNLSIGLSNIIDIFEPEAICLGGSFAYFKEIFFEKLKNKIETERYVFNKDSLPDIILANLINDAGILGACAN